MTRVPQLGQPDSLSSPATDVYIDGTGASLSTLPVPYFFLMNYYVLLL